MPKILIYISLLIGILLIFVTIFSFAFRKNNHQPQIQINTVQEEIKEEKKEEIKPEEIKIEEETLFEKIIFITMVIISIVLELFDFFQIFVIQKNKNHNNMKFPIIKKLMLIIFLISTAVKKEKKVIITYFVTKILFLFQFFIKSPEKSQIKKNDLQDEKDDLQKESETNKI